MTLKKLVAFIYIVLSLISMPINADSTQERRIIISTLIFPRLIAVDQNLTDKLDESGNVRIGIIYHSNIDKAKKVDRLISRKIKKIAAENITIDYIDINRINQLENKPYSGFFIAQLMSKSDISRIIQFSNKHNILNFSPFEGDVERGIIASIFIGAKIKPYFNIKSLVKAGVSLKPALLRVSKVYE